MNLRDPEFHVHDTINNENEQNVDGHTYDEVQLRQLYWTIKQEQDLMLLKMRDQKARTRPLVMLEDQDHDLPRMLISSYFWGYLMDSAGRRSVLILTTVGGNITSLVSMFLPSFWLLFVARIFIGIFIAVAASGTYAYLGEFVLPHLRPLVVNVATTFTGISHLYVPFTSWLVLSMNWTLYLSDSFAFRPWRLLLFVNFLPGTVALLMLWYLPESPKWLFSKNQDERAFSILDWVCKKNTGKTLADFEVFKIILPAEDMQNKIEQLNLKTQKSCFGIIQKMWNDTVPLFKRPHVLNFLLCCILLFGALFTSTGVGLWFPQIESRIGTDVKTQTVCQIIDTPQKTDVSNNQTSSFCDDSIKQHTFIASGIMGAIHVIIYIVVNLVINFIGRKALIVILLTSSGVFGIALNWVTQYIGLLASLILLLVLPGLSTSVIASVVIDLVPTQLRGKAVCIAYMFGRAGGISGLNLMGSLLELYCIETFATVSVFMLVCAAITFAIPM